MKIRRNAKNLISKGIKQLAIKTAGKDMNTACICFQYQPKRPNVSMKTVIR